MIRLSILLVFICCFFSCGENESQNNKATNTPSNEMTQPEMENNVISNKTKQLVIVLSEHVDSVKASLLKFEFSNKKWNQVTEAHDVTLGRTGLAWGSGENNAIDGYQKKEGDGKSPAGIFKFGTAFGYASKENVPELKIPYVHVTHVTQCIEDSNSKYYNQIVDNSKVKKDWNTADFMRRDDDLYKWGVFIQHNTPAIAEAGSCIFFHLWRGPGKHTAGCTAMTEDNMFNLLKWLDEEKEPRLVQLVSNDYKEFAEQYGLPEL